MEEIHSQAFTIPYKLELFGICLSTEDLCMLCVTIALSEAKALSFTGQSGLGKYTRLSIWGEESKRKDGFAG